jgi:beta-alanine degradation protein BauB
MRCRKARTIVVLKGGTLDVIDASGATKEKMNRGSGTAYWLDADPPNTRHRDMNRGKEPIEVIVVELKNQP